MTEQMGASQEIKLAENLKKILATKKLTVTDTAKKVRMHKSTLHGYCNGVVPRNLGRRSYGHPEKGIRQQAHRLDEHVKDQRAARRKN